MSKGVRPKATASPSLMRQVKALIQSKKKDAADVTRTTANIGVTRISCLTSSTDFATAASGTGILDMDGDSALINNVKIVGNLDSAAILDLDPASNNSPLVRKILVWFNKPLLVASAAGTLPPITEVLVTDSVLSMRVTDAANAGRFVVLWDQVWDMGSNTFQAATAVGHARVSGKNRHYINKTIKVNKQCHFAANGVSGAPSGHYDSDVAAGRIDKGLLCLYTLFSTNIAGGALVDDISTTRLNYTG